MAGMIFQTRSSVMDVENLHSGQELPDTYTIFITEKDFFGRGRPVYPIERINLAAGNFFEDGEHILYINGAYQRDSEPRRLMHDFNYTKADDMNFEPMAERTRYLKENPEGVRRNALSRSAIVTNSRALIEIVLRF